MALSLVSALGEDSASGSTHSITVPSTAVLENDLIIWAINGDQVNYDPPTGFTELPNSPYTQTDVRLRIGYKIAAGGEEDDVLVSGSGVGDNAVVSVQVWRGGDASTPFDLADPYATSDTNAGSGSITAPTATTVTNGAVVLAFFAQDRHGVHTLDAGLTEVFNTTGSSASMSMSCGYDLITTAGATGTYTTTSTQAGEEWVAVNLPLRPASAGGGGNTFNPLGGMINSLGIGLIQ